MTVDLVFRNGAVYCGTPTHQSAQAVAVSAGRIVAVGSNEDVARVTGVSTEVVDLAGRMLVAGFQDAHVHPLSGGVEMLRCDLNQATGPAAALMLIADYASSHPSLEWITGGGWSSDWYPGGNPAAADLDRVISDRPVFLPNRDGHSAWVNSIAMSMAGIDATTPDPRDGRIERLPDGTPLGTLHEGAQHLVENVMPADTPEDLERGLVAGNAYLNRCGVTGWQDAIVTPPELASYRSLAAADRLVGHASLSLWWDRELGLEQIEWFEQERLEPTPGLRINTVKLMLDGVFENFTAAMLESYEGKEPAGTSGLDFIDPALLPLAVTKLDKLGFQCHFHAIGDRAVRNALDAVAAARTTNGPSDLRHHIAHIQVVHPEDIPRFGQLGVVANAQPLWASHGHAQDVLTIPFLGEERAGWQYPFGSLHRANATLAMGSDWSVSTANVMQEIEVAVTRIDRDEGDLPVFLPDERLELETCLDAFTSGSAFVNHREMESGSIEVGKLADLVVLDRNPFQDRAIGDSQVDLTVIGGKSVYERM